MAKTAQASDTSLEVRRTIPAPRERVFQAWTRPEDVKKWAAPGEMTTPIAEVDLRVGGKYRIEMQSPNGARHVASGVYREVTPPKRLVYTWGWEDSSVKDSVVTVEFQDRGKSTEVILRHERLPDAESRARHTEGWTECMEKFVALF
ncbi:MAG TPA: SRPBCC domain-containing protein [Gemmatimonadaceae bacterium]